MAATPPGKPAEAPTPTRGGSWAAAAEEEAEEGESRATANATCRTRGGRCRNRADWNSRLRNGEMTTNYKLNRTKKSFFKARFFLKTFLAASRHCATNENSPGYLNSVTSG